MASSKKPDDRLDAIVNLSKRRGLVFPSSEIYGGLRAAWDYGPLGVELKNNVKRQWWKSMVHQRDDIVGLDSSVILNPIVWETSGHITAFVDPLTECQSCHKRFRALMRRIGLGESLRIALMGNDERVSADTALRIGLVSEVVAPEALWTRAHQIAATIAAKPPSATQGTVKAIWESLDKPYRAALDQGLIYTRLGNPIGTAELAARGKSPAPDPTIR